VAFSVILRDPLPAGGSVTGLEHLPFFEALAAIDESHARWPALQSGLLTLRLADKAWQAQRLGTRLERWEIAAVVEAVEGMDEGNVVRRLLGHIVEQIADRPSNPAAATPGLVAYARALQFEAEWKLAADVYRTAMGFALASENYDLAATASGQLGYCLRMAGDLDDAQAAYDESRAISQSNDDIAGALRADIGQASIALHRGNLPEAAAMLDGVIEEALNAQLPDVVSRALQDRAEVAARRGQLDAAVVDAYRALELCDDATRRDRILADIANLLGMLGHHVASQQAFQVLALTAQEQYLRWLATVNLLELASLQGSEPMFERYRRELADAQLPPLLSAYLQLYLGHGNRRFNRQGAARDAYERAIAVAQEHHVNEVLIRAEVALRELTHAKPADAPAAELPSPSVQDVIAAIGAIYADSARRGSVTGVTRVE
jgi:tetratricopeptide (TPR) repeat protein